MEEFGIFTDEGCVEGGFGSRESAEARADWYRRNGEVVSVHEVCSEHDEQIAGRCEECDAEEES